MPPRPQNSSVVGSLGGGGAGATSTGSGRFRNRYTATSMSTTVGTTSGVVRITATNSAGTAIFKDFTLVKQSSLTGGAAAPVNTEYTLNVTALPAADPFQMYFAPANPNDPNINNNPANFAVAATSLYDGTTARPWKDGISIYIHSVAAEDRALTGGVPDRSDSAVRFWNGRGSAPSLPAATTVTGFTAATNDAVYIVGHFNADGTINATSTDTANPTGYSAVYPESNTEFLASLMGDAITILSQPQFSSGGGGVPPYVQSAGWADSLSSHNTGGGDDNWQTTAPSGSNSVDGIRTSMNVGNQPNRSIPGNGSSRSSKFSPIDTEISTCLLIGIVPTNANPSALSVQATPTAVTNGPASTGANGQTSGGVHNYPRLLEVWGSAGLYIRGSMVAMFESRVAMEPWSIRVYSAPGRYWGMNAALSSSVGSHHVPLEPLLLNARRMRFKELTPGQYSSQKTIIEALTH